MFGGSGLWKKFCWLSRDISMYHSMHGDLTLSFMHIVAANLF